MKRTKELFRKVVYTFVAVVLVLGLVPTTAQAATTAQPERYLLETPWHELAVINVYPAPSSCISASEWYATLVASITLLVRPHTNTMALVCIEASVTNFYQGDISQVGLSVMLVNGLDFGNYFPQLKWIWLEKDNEIRYTFNLSYYYEEGIRHYYIWFPQHQLECDNLSLWIIVCVNTIPQEELPATPKQYQTNFWTRLRNVDYDGNWYFCRRNNVPDFVLGITS